MAYHERIVSFAAKWGLAPPAPGDGFEDAELAALEARLGSALPASVREWYQRVGRRYDLTGSPCCHPLPPSRVEESDGVVVLYRGYDDADGMAWGVRRAELARDDPPVFADGAEVASTFSGFVLNVLLHETVDRRWSYGGLAFSLTPKGVAQVKESYTRLPIPAWYPPSRWYESVELFGDADSIVRVEERTGDTGPFTVNFAARTLDAYQRLRELLEELCDFKGRDQPLLKGSRESVVYKDPEADQVLAEYEGTERYLGCVKLLCDSPGVFISAPWAVADYERDEDYTEVVEDDWPELQEAGAAAVLATGEGVFVYIVVRGSPSQAELARAKTAHAFGLRIEGGALCVRQFYALEDWYPLCPPHEQVAVPDGLYLMHALCIGDEGVPSLIVLHLEPVEALPAPAHERVPTIWPGRT